MSRETRPCSPVRATAVLLAVPASTAALAWLLVPGLLDAARALGTGAWRALPFDQALVRGAEAVALGCLGWLSVVTVLVVSPALRNGTGSAAALAPVRGCPAWLQRALLAACGIGLTATLAAPAHADLAPRAATGGTVGDRHVVAGLPYPDRAVGEEAGPSRDRRADRSRAGRAARRTSALARADASGPAAGVATASAPGPRRDRTHTVRPGDTLWGVAAADLGPGAADAAVADRWHRIHRHNAAVLGPDPDLIHPGTVLRLPAEQPE